MTTAYASEWGCKVLLCSADEQGWQSNPSCHPPMLKLIACHFKTFGACPWPTCPESGQGEPGNEKYADCPTGWSPATPTNTRDDSLVSFNNEQSICQKIVENCGSGRLIFDRETQNNCRRTVEMSRPLRDKPYFWDLVNDETGGVTRTYFDLNRP